MEKYRRHDNENVVDIIIVGWNNTDLTLRCIESIARNTPVESYHVTYVDNGSKPVDFRRLSYDICDKQGFYTQIHLPFNHGYVRGTNVGLALSLLSNSKYVLLLNNDVWIPDGDTTWLERLMFPMQASQDIGAVGAVSNNVFGYQRRDAPLDGKEYPFTTVPALIGFCLLIRKDALMQVGLLDERFEPGNYEDFDLSYRLTAAGWKLAIAESVFIHHKMHASFSKLDENFHALLVRNKGKFIDKWGVEIASKVGIL